MADGDELLCAKCQASLLRRSEPGSGPKDSDEVVCVYCQVSDRYDRALVEGKAYLSAYIKDQFNKIMSSALPGSGPVTFKPAAIPKRRFKFITGKPANGRDGAAVQRKLNQDPALASATVAGSTVPAIPGTAPANWNLIDGPVGASGAKHNVAAVQAALTKMPLGDRTKPYWSSAIDGHGSPALAIAIVQFQKTFGLKESGELKPGDETETALLKLLPEKFKRMKGISGTGTVLIYPQTVRGSKISDGWLLSGDLRKKLEGLLKDMSADYGFPFDAGVSHVPANKRILYASILPQDILVHDKGKWEYISDDRSLQRYGGPLAQLIEGDLKKRAKTLFRIKEKADLDAQQSFRHRLAIIVRSEADTVLEKYQGYLATGKANNWTFAVKMLEHYLSVTGTPITISRDEALSLNIVQQAATTNITRFREQNFENPAANNAIIQSFESLRNNVNGVAAFADHWKVDISTIQAKGIFRLLKAASTDIGEHLNISSTASYYFGAGDSSIRSTGMFGLTMQGNKVIINGSVEHVWSDLGYDFNVGSIYQEETAILEAAGYAKPFQWKAVWRDRIDGVLQLDRSFWRDPSTSNGHVLQHFHVTPVA